MTVIRYEGRTVLTPRVKRLLAALLLLAVLAYLTWRGLNPVHGAHPVTVIVGTGQ